MKTISMTEYLLLALKSMELRGLAICLTVLCLLMLVIQVLEIGLKVLLLIGLLYSIYRVMLSAVSLLYNVLGSVGASKPSSMNVLLG